MPTQPIVSEQEIEYYRTNGFVRVRGILPKEEAARFGERAAALYEERKLSGNFGGGGNRDVLRQIVNVWRDDPVMKELTFHPNVVAAAKALDRANPMFRPRRTRLELMCVSRVKSTGVARDEDAHRHIVRRPLRPGVWSDRHSWPRLVRHGRSGCDAGFGADAGGRRLRRLRVRLCRPER